MAGHAATSASLVAAITWWQGLLWMLLILVAAWVVLLLVLVMLGRGGLARTTARLVPDLLVLFRRLLGDRRVPRRSKVAVALTLAYLAMPLDIVPDFIPVAGQLDDVIVVGLALRYALRRAGPDLVREHWPGSPEGLKLVLQLAGCAYWSGGGPDAEAERPPHRGPDADAERPPQSEKKRDDRRDS